jgi:hypothetical protein
MGGKKFTINMNDKIVRTLYETLQDIRGFYISTLLIDLKYLEGSQRF